MTASLSGAKSRLASIRTFVSRFYSRFLDAGTITRVKDTASLILFITWLLFQLAVIVAAIINVYCVFYL